MTQAKKTSFRAGPINSVQDASRAFSDLETFLSQQHNVVVLDSPPAAGQIGVVVARDDGTYELWSLIAGAGVTVAKNPGTKTITITSP